MYNCEYYELLCQIKWFSEFQPLIMNSVPFFCVHFCFASNVAKLFNSIHLQALLENCLHSMSSPYDLCWLRFWHVWSSGFRVHLRIILISWVSVWYPWKRLVIPHISIPNTISYDFYNHSFRRLNMRWSDSKNDKQQRFFAIDACKCYECVILGIGHRTFSYL